VLPVAHSLTHRLTDRRRKWIVRLAIAFLLYLVVGFLVLPPIIKWQLRKQLPAITHRAAAVQSVRVNPLSLSLGIRGLALTEADGTAFASFSNLYVNFEALGSLFQWAWTFKEVRLGSPYAYAAVFTNGQFNFANLLTNSASTAPTNATPKLPPRVLVKSLEITNGTIAVADFFRATPFQTAFTPIDVRLTNFTTRPNTDGPYAFTASTGEGEYFKWAGSIAAVPPASAGRFELGGIDLKKYATYLREFAQLDVRDGKVTVAATYTFALATNGLQLTVTNANVELSQLQIFAPDAAAGSTNALVNIPRAAVHGAEADLQRRTARVKRVETIGGMIHARRLRDGNLELLQLAMAPTNRPPSILNPPQTNSATPATNAPWSVLIENVSVSDYAMHVVDEQTPTPANLLADKIGLTIKGLSVASNAPVSIELSARVGENGSVKLQAKGSLIPLALDADVDVSAIELRPFQPYVEQQRVKLAFTKGSVSTQGRVSVAVGGTNELSAHFGGDVALDDVAVIDQIQFQDFVSWKQIAARGIDFTLAPMVVKVREVACNELVTAIVVGTNKQLTALAVLPAPTNSATNSVSVAAPVQGASPVLFPIQLDLLALTNASIKLADFSIEPNCRFSVQQFGGTVRGLSSQLNTAAEVDIRGNVNETAPFSISGKVNPLVRDLFVDLVISNHNTELTPFTPYLEKFGGYPLTKGKLTVGLSYTVRGKALESQNIVHVDQLTLGARNNSPDATKLPVKLGVALLKDRNGRIALDVPVKGRLDDPKFSVVPIAWQVVMNLLTKAATSPFSLLGALVGGGEELSYIEFTPGQALVGETEAAKIEKLSKALYERPALNLEITGAADETLDRAALAWLKMERSLKNTRMAELTGKPDAPATVDKLRLTARDYERLLKAAYRKAFNRDTVLAVVVTNASGAVTNVVSRLRTETRKGAEAQMARAPTKRTAETNATPVTDPRITTRPASLPVVPVDNEVLAQMEMELFASTAVTPDDLRELMDSRAQAVQQALLKSERVTAERLFILKPSAESSAKGQSRANLSLN
jgi:hypothetical protein